MEKINQLRTFYQLKNVERASTVGKRKESAAEHSWSCLILADYFLTLISDSKLDRRRVYELLIYHDLIEIKTGDVNIIDEEKREDKGEKEKQAMEKIKEEIPLIIREKFVKLFKEYEEGKTRESKFARAIDALDPIIHEMDYKKDWKGWTEEFLRKKKEPLFEGFPVLKEAFEKMLAFQKKEGYFDQ